MMEELKLNETPIRTARNFNINNIKLKNISIPSKINDFSNIKINGENIKDYILENKNIEIKINKSNIVCTDLKYGIGITSSINTDIKVEICGKIKEPYEIEFDIDNDNINLSEVIEINAYENSKASIVLKYKTTRDVQGFHNGILKVNASKNSKIDIVVVNFVNEKTNNFLSIENNLDEESNLKYTMVDFGGKNNVINYYSNIKGNKSNNTINAIYLAKDEQLFDLNYIGELYGLESNIDIDVQGAIKDNAKKHFKGTIDFKRGCKKAKGNENEFCTILSDTAKSIALPMLLCEEEEVEGNHSTSAGKIEENELFYIMSRGFEQKDAMKLIVRAKFNKVIENISNENLKQEILDEIDNRLS